MLSVILISDLLFLFHRFQLQTYRPAYHIHTYIHTFFLFKTEKQTVVNKKQQPIQQKHLAVKSLFLIAQPYNIIVMGGGGRGGGEEEEGDLLRLNTCNY